MKLRIIIALLPLISLLYSCTPKTIVKTYTDTLYSFRTDTVKVTQVSQIRDTVREKESYYYTLTEGGDTSKTIIIHDYYHNSTQNDSTALYRAILDSLAEFRNQSKELSTSDPETQGALSFAKNNCWLPILFLIGIIALLLFYIFRRK